MGLTNVADVALHLAGMLMTAGAIWGAIRSDLRALRRDVDRLEKVVFRHLGHVDAHR